MIFNVYFLKLLRLVYSTASRTASAGSPSVTFLDGIVTLLSDGELPQTLLLCTIERAFLAELDVGALLIVEVWFQSVYFSMYVCKCMYTRSIIRSHNEC